MLTERRGNGHRLHRLGQGHHRAGARNRLRGHCRKGRRDPYDHRLGPRLLRRGHRQDRTDR